jgi:general secretion pathway protein D
MTHNSASPPFCAFRQAVLVCLVLGGLQADLRPAFSADLPGWLGGKKSPKPIVHQVKPPPSGPVVPTVGEASDQKSLVKLNYVSAPWDKVLADLAVATESELVIERGPTGRFSRRDQATHTRTEAVRIINKEIEAQGFRLIEKGKFLIVLDLPSQRPRYAPATIMSHTDRTTSPVLSVSTDAPSTGNRPYERNITSITDPGPSSEIAVAAPAVPQQQSIAAPKPHITSNRVTPVNHEVNKEKRPQISLTETATNEPPSLVAQEDYRPVNRSALDLAKGIHKAFRTRAKLVNQGTTGFPAFDILSSKSNPKDRAEPETLLQVAIDTENDRLLVNAQPGFEQAAAELCGAFDTPVFEDHATHFLITSASHARIAVQLAPEIPRMRERAQLQRVGYQPKEAETNRWAAFEQAADTNESLNAPPAAEPEAPPAGPIPNALKGVIGNLKGDVSLEAIEDLGVLILRGNQGDVDQVLKVIKELERLSEGASPQLHVLYLKHVDSTAMATLLTSVYERLAKFPGGGTVPRQSVSILPIDTPNALLIVAPEADIQSIREIADELDRPTDPDTEFRVFSLKTAIASQVVTLITDFYRDRVGLGAKVTATADLRSNAVIVRARPRDLDEVAALVEKIDGEQTAAINQLKIYQLKNAVAQELASVLNAAIQSVLSPPQANTAGGGFGGFGGFGGQGGGQVAEQFRAVRPALIEFLTTGPEGEEKVRSGMLADIRITADSRMNSLLVAAPPASSKLLAELIAQLDRPSSAVAEIKVFTLANADAQKMVEQLQALFAPANASQGQGGTNQVRQQLGLSIVGAEDISSSLIPLRFSVDTRTNSVMAIGGGEALRVVEALILRLDESDIRQRKNIVVKLKNSPAATVSQAVREFLQSRVQLAQQNPQLVSSIEQLEQEAVVVPEPVSNSLLISATPRYFDEIRQLVTRLDEAPRQVVIQAMLVEVELNHNDEFGIELGFQDSVLFNRSVTNNLVTLATTTTAPNGVQTTTQRLISQTGSPGYLFGNPSLPLGNNTSRDASNPNRVGSQALSSFSVGRVNGDLGYGGLVLSAGSESVNVLMRALAARRRLQILSRPQIRTLDNQLAQIQVGQQVPIVDGVQINQLGNANPQIRQDQAGIILTVTPRISPDGLIVMELVAEKSAFSGRGVPIFTDTTNGNVIESPIKDISAARTAVSVPNGQTVVMGGMITTSDETIERKVPWLGDVPILGSAFRYDAKNHRRTELLIFLTPRIIHNEADSEVVKEVEMARMHFIEQEAEELHGPLRSVPQENNFGPEMVPPFDPNLLPPASSPPENLPPIDQLPPPGPVDPRIPPDPLWGPPPQDWGPPPGPPAWDVPPGPAQNTPGDPRFGPSTSKPKSADRPATIRLTRQAK